MARCKDRESFKKRFFHYWMEWGQPFTAVYRGKETIVQKRACLYCKKAQIREC